MFGFGSKSSSITDNLCEAYQKANSAAEEEGIEKINTSVNGQVISLPICVDQAPIHCEMGSVDEKLTVLDHGYKVHTAYGAHDEDREVGVNIPSFGICKATGNPCVPVPFEKWLLTDEYNIISNQNQLLDQANREIKKFIDIAHQYTSLTYFFGGFKNETDFLREKFEEAALPGVPITTLEEITQRTENIYNLYYNDTEFQKMLERRMGPALFFGRKRELAKIDSKVSEYSNEMLESLKNIKELKEKWSKEGIGQKAKENNILTINSILPCPAYGGIIHFLDCGQLRNSMTPAQYLQYVYKYGMYATELGADLAILQLGDAQIIAQIYDGQRYFLNEGDLDKFLAFVGASDYKDTLKYESIDHILSVLAISVVEGGYDYTRGMYTTSVGKTIPLEKDNLFPVYKIPDLIEAYPNAIDLNGKYESLEQPIYIANGFFITIKLIGTVSNWKGSNKTKLAITYNAEFQNLLDALRIAFKGASVTTANDYFSGSLGDGYATITIQGQSHKISKNGMTPTITVDLGQGKQASLTMIVEFPYLKLNIKATSKVKNITVDLLINIRYDLRRPVEPEQIEKPSLVYEIATNLKNAINGVQLELPVEDQATFVATVEEILAIILILGMALA